MSKMYESFRMLEVNIVFLPTGDFVVGLQLASQQL